MGEKRLVSGCGGAYIQFAAIAGNGKVVQCVAGKIRGLFGDMVTENLLRVGDIISGGSGRRFRQGRDDERDNALLA